MSLRSTIAGAVASVLLAAASAVSVSPVALAQEGTGASTPRSGQHTSAREASARPSGVGSLSIPALHTGRIPVRRVAARHGAIQIPANVRTVGWWRGSRPFAAREGSSVVVGHVSGPGDAPGALSRLPRLHRGDRIVWRVGSRRQVFRVVAKTYTPRTGQLPERVWNVDGARTINLITCARKRVERDGFYHYTHNLTVTAVLVGPR